MFYISNTSVSLLRPAIRAEENQPASGTVPQLVSVIFLIKVIRALYDVYRFKNFILYISEELEVNSVYAVEFFANLFGGLPFAPLIIITSGNKTDPTLYHIDVLISRPSLSLVFSTGPNDTVMALATESMKRVHIFKTIFILFPMLQTDAIYDTTENYSLFWESVNKMCAWIWREQFLYTILLTIGDNIYTLDPYPNLKIVNKTGNWHVADFFIDYYHDFKGYVLKTVIHYDLPRIFDRRYEQNNLLISGTSGKLFTTFTKSINVTLVDYTVMSSPYEPIEMGEVIDLIANRTIEFSPHSLTALFDVDYVGRSYPIGINDWCIMVPLYNRSAEHLYLQHSFQYYTWLLVLFAVIYISFALWLCTPKRPREYSSALLQAICSMLNIAHSTFFNTPNLNLRMRFIFFCLSVIGSITSNWYITKIASYLMTSLPSPQIVTVDDVIRANLRIKVFDYEYERLKSMPAQYPQRFLQQLDIVDKQFMDQHRDTLNTSFGYSIQSDRWEFLDMQQQFLRQPLFRRSDICVGPFHHVFPLYTDSHLNLPLTYFIMYASQSGFLIYWRKKAFTDAIRLKLVKIILIHEEPRPLSLSFLLPIWYVWGLGLTIAFIFFICELKGISLSRLKSEGGLI
ncbi:uncharacterized protein LOC129244314 [Anastrepha obliqua]|uniref:uncharacterized protein LOC129244314 n=1 Tax=Anastrepha obliqua TaxID=95512 RepID=UPI002409A87E|nr:uncharacterized protein LOC129244314 [Anastrepha obliqua]